MLLNPETLDSFKSQYRPKFALLFVVYLIVSTRESKHLPLLTSITSTIPSTSPLEPILPRVSNDFLTAHALIDSPARESPVTPPFVPGKETIEDGRGTSLGDRVTAKGSTSQDANSSSWITTPPLSVPPPTRSITSVRGARTIRCHESGRGTTATTEGCVEELPEFSPKPSLFHGGAVHEDPSPVASFEKDRSDDREPSHLEISDCPIDYRGRPLCPNTTRIPLSLRKRSSELADALQEFGHFFLTSLHTLFLSLLRIRLSPYFLFFGIFHLLEAVQLVSLIVEDSIIRIGLSNPLPPDFVAKSFGKQMTRLKWRCKATASRYWRQMGTIGLLLLVVGLVGRESFKGGRMPSIGGVPFAWLFLSTTDDEQKEVELGFRWFKDLVQLETLSALVSLLQPTKHLLPTSLIPATLSHFPLLDPSSIISSQPLTSFFPRALRPSYAERSTTTSTSRICLETSWLISLLVDASTSLLTLLQFSLVMLALPSWSPFTLCPHLVLHSCLSRVRHIASLRASMFRTIECLRTVFTAFPENGAGSGRLDKDEDWVCSICFEGVEVEAPSGGENNDDRIRGKTIGERCCLPCGHKYHAGCLVHWLHFQSWCPICHLPVVSSSPSSPPPSAVPAEPRHSIVDYPGARHRLLPSTHSTIEPLVTI